jgi:poly-beta-1,6-N-acetyl-D-glucosamine N-deacetylase
VNFAKIRAIANYIHRPEWLLTSSILTISTPIAIVTLAQSTQIAVVPIDPSTQTCAMSGVYNSLVQLSDRLNEDNRSEELKTIALEHRTSTWREAIDFDRPITTERKTLHKVPFVFVSGGRLTTIHASKPQQVAEIIDRYHVAAGVDGAFFMMHDSESNQLIGPSLSRTDDRFHPGTAYEVMRSAGRPLVLMDADTVKFIPFDPQRHNTLEGIRDELPHVSDAFIAAGWLVQKGQPQTLASFGNLYKADEPRYRAFWGFDRDGQPKLGISTKNIGAVELGEVLAQEGWQEAVMVDSGQSTSLAYEGKSLVPGYVPRPVPHAIGLLPPIPKLSGVNSCQPFNRKSAAKRKSLSATLSVTPKLK